ncbi:putative SUA7-TFIIB subunit, factor E [Violaceomyces palustris]|uniref:SUA7-TFIIB subunit, factor E n=1 Tax=Violaceomyces palustris TaxID=1673888 RepID=A0ACD0NT77_9BASI|nr:putative SUA7-TFIIB subunit, factor E [Violaceomyces palustris]
MFHARYAADRGDAPKKDDDFVPDLNVRLICRDCQVDPPNLTEEFASGDLVCADCGLVVGENIIDTRSEWRTFSNEDGDDPSRVGSAGNPLLDGINEQLDTRIGSRDGGSGASRDLQRTANRATGVRDRNMLDAFEDIQRKCDSIHLPRTVSDVAKQAYRRVEEEKILRGKKPDAIIAAAIYVACKMGQVPRTFPEICSLTSVSKKHIGQCFKEMQQAFGLNATGTGSVDGSRLPGGPDAATASTTALGIGPTGAADLVVRYCNHLGLEMPIIRSTEAITQRVRELGVLAGRSPITIAAACIYFSTQLWGVNKSAKKISQAAGVSDVTIKNSFKELLKHKEQIASPEILSKNSRMDLSNLS